MSSSRISKQKHRKFVHIQLRSELETEVSTCYLSAEEALKLGTKLADNVRLFFPWPFWAQGLAHQVGMKHSEV